jgi:hypothetical protein
LGLLLGSGRRRLGVLLGSGRRRLGVLLGSAGPPKPGRRPTPGADLSVRPGVVCFGPERAQRVRVRQAWRRNRRRESSSSPLEGIEREEQLHEVVMEFRHRTREGVWDGSS